MDAPHNLLISLDGPSGPSGPSGIVATALLPCLSYPFVCLSVCRRSKSTRTTWTSWTTQSFQWVARYFSWTASLPSWTSRINSISPVNFSWASRLQSISLGSISLGLICFDFLGSFPTGVPGGDAEPRFKSLCKIFKIVGACNGIQSN